VEGSLRAKKQRDPSSRFDTIPACDRQTDRQTQSRNESLPVSPNQPCQMTTAAGGAVTMTTVTIVDWEFVACRFKIRKIRKIRKNSRNLPI